MKKVISLTESDLMRLVKRVIKEQSKAPLFSIGDKVKIPIKKNGTYIICRITDIDDSSKEIDYRYKVISSTYPEMGVGYNNSFFINNNTYTLYSSEGEGSGGILQTGPITEIKKM